MKIKKTTDLHHQRQMNEKKNEKIPFAQRIWEPTRSAWLPSWIQKPDLCHSIQLKCEIMLNVRLQNTFATNLFRSSIVPISMFHHRDLHHLVKRLKLFYVTFNCRWKMKHSNIFRLLGAKWSARKENMETVDVLVYWSAPETLYLRSNYPF